MTVQDFLRSSKFLKKKRDYIKRYDIVAIQELEHFDKCLQWCLQNPTKNLYTDVSSTSPHIVYVDCHEVADILVNDEPIVLQMLYSLKQDNVIFKMCSYVPIGSCKESLAYALGLASGLIPPMLTLAQARTAGYLVNTSWQDGHPLACVDGITSGLISPPITLTQARAAGYGVNSSQPVGQTSSNTGKLTKGHVSKDQILIDDSAHHLIEKYLIAPTGGYIWLNTTIDISELPKKWPKTWLELLNTWRCSLEQLPDRLRELTKDN